MILISLSNIHLRHQKLDLKFLLLTLLQGDCMVKHHPHKRGKRFARKRKGRRRAKRRVTASAVARALGSTMPYKTAIEHTVGTVDVGLGLQNMTCIGAVGAVNAAKTGSDGAVSPGSLYITLAEQQNIIQPYTAAYTVNSEQTTNVHIINDQFYFKSQKARFMFTNSSTAVLNCELYHVYCRRAYDFTNTVGFQDLIGVAGNWTVGQDIIPTLAVGHGNQMNATVPGCTLYDHAGITQSFYIRRVGVKRLEPGANALHIMRTRKPYTLNLKEQFASYDVAYVPHLTCFLVVRVWGEMINATGAPTLASTRLVWGCIYRTKYKRLSNPIYGAIERGSDRVNMSAGTVGALIMEENPAGTTVGTVAPTLV